MSFLSLPESFHLVEREISEGLARIDCSLLHTAETRDEFLVGTLERRLGIYAIESAGVDQRKEQIAKFALQKIVILVGNLDINLGTLLADLCPYVLLLLPIEANRRSLLADAERLDQRR